VRLVRIGPAAVYYRFLTPEWAYLPTSGAGAAQNGGRFNRPGIEALYLSGDVETALAEYRQGASITSPATLVTYRIELTEAVDFSQGFDPSLWPALWVEHACAWKYITRIEKKIPPTWKIGDGLIRDGRQGLLFPSARQAGGINLVIFNANLTAVDRIEPHDPEGRLPRDQRSWRPTK
jgi:RES domain-containing protein